MKIIEKGIEELKPYANNPRNNENAINKVANSIKDFGFKVPILIDKNNIIVCGHTRYEASKVLNLKSVPCIVIDDLTEEQIKLFRIVDNKAGEYAFWDYDRLDEELEKILNLNMEDYGFITVDFNWEDYDEISEDNYDEPMKELRECPHCHHIDSKIHFKKVGIGEEE